MEKNYPKISSPITTWNEKDRPREKMLAYGKSALQDFELLAILVGSGSRNETAVALCKRMLETANNDLVLLGKWTIQDLMQFKGIGEAKAISIAAALELGRRRQSENVDLIKKISSSKDVYRIFLAELADLLHEEFWILFLSKSNNIVGKENISKGGMTATVVDVRTIMKMAISRSCTSIILVHNHPSGNLKPSQADLKITKKLVEAGKILDISVLDHIIVSSSGYYSFADEEMI